MRTVTEVYSVSTGTLREEDLIEAFSVELELLDYPDADQIRADALTLIEEENTEQMSYFLHEVLFPAMEDCAGEGLYFGSSEGDGAEFGFWSDFE